MMKSTTLSFSQDEVHRHFDVRHCLIQNMMKGNKSTAYIQSLLCHEEALKNDLLQVLRELTLSHSQQRITDEVPAKHPEIGQSTTRTNTTVSKAIDNDELCFTSMSCHTLWMCFWKVLAIICHRGDQLRDSFRNFKIINAMTDFLSSVRMESPYYVWSIRGLEVIILYCFAHLSFYEFLYTIITEISKTIVHQNVFYATLMVASLLVLVVTGGALTWVSDDDRYVAAAVAKALPSRTMMWFEKRPFLKSSVDICCLYGCFIAIAHFQNHCLLGMMDLRKDLHTNLPSVVQGSPSILGYSMIFGFDRVSEQNHNNNSLVTCGYENSFFSSAMDLDTNFHYHNVIQKGKTDLLEEDRMYLWSTLSMSSYYFVMGSLEGPLVSAFATFLYFGVCTVVSFSLMWRLGLHFWAK